MKKFLMGIFVLVLGLSVGFGTVSRANGITANVINYYLPFIGTTPVRSIFGVELALENIQVALPTAVDAGSYWTRVNGLLWSDIQPNNASDWKWGNASGLEANLAQITSAGAQPILVIRSTPGWAQLYAGKACGPMTSNQIGNFANFVKEAVKRYSAPPYGVTYYELWNEEDVDPSQALDPLTPWGCWGNFNDPYFGGGYYAEMLKQVYPAIKAANPKAQVLIGGLLMDCNPSNCPAGQYVNTGKFFEGVLKNNGGAYFDIANFHGYTHNIPGSSPILMEATNYPKWPNGGVVQGKINFLRQIMTKYGINKPIFQSEAALIYDYTLQLPAFEQAKADYVVWVYTRNMAEGLLGTTWFTFYGGWKKSSLVDGYLNPLPAYQALQFTTHELVGSIYKGPITTSAGLRGFGFTRESKEVWALFSTDGATHNFTVPAGLLAAYDVFGVPITPSGGVISVTHPVWIETTP